MDIQNDNNKKFEEQNTQFQQNISVKFDELKTEINKMQIKCESNWNELKYEVNETLSRSLNNMTNIKNDEIVEDVVLNSEDNDINYNSDSIVGVKNNGETNDENIIKNSTDEFVECDYEMLRLSLIHI